MSNTWQKAYKFLLIITFFLIALGASVRAMNAGLACPDWPLCFGDVIPDYHPQVYFEFIHRALAGVVAIITVFLHTVLIRSPKMPPNLRMLAYFSILLLGMQVVLGGLTVLMNLHEEVVAAHLSMGTAFFGVLCWIYYSVSCISKPASQSPGETSPFAALQNAPRIAQVFAPLALAAVYMQIVLGGFVASHYAALVCTDFPTCHGKLIPTLDGIIGLQVIHRLGAYALTLILVCYSAYILLNFADKTLRKMSWGLLALILTQVGIGIANVVLLRPPVITVMHLAAGTALLGLTVVMTRRLSFVRHH